MVWEGDACEGSGAEVVATLRCVGRLEVSEQLQASILPAPSLYDEETHLEPTSSGTDCYR
jgi:hypothetical protein